MLVKDVIAQAAYNAGRQDVVELIEAEHEEDPQVLLFVHCYNLVENELALDYFPLTMREEVETKDGTASYSALSETPCRILSVTRAGEKIAFETDSDKLTVKGGGVVVVRYAYLPQKKTLKEGSSYGDATKRILALGIAAEYLLLNGFYPEAKVLDGKYRDAIRAAGKLRGIRIPIRRWA